MSFEKQIMFSEKYPNMPYYPSNIFRNARGFEHWEISLEFNAGYHKRNKKDCVIDYHQAVLYH